MLKLKKVELIKSTHITSLFLIKMFKTTEFVLEKKCNFKFRKQQNHL